MYKTKPIRLILAAVLVIPILTAAGLPVVFEPGIKSGEWIARVGSSAVVVTSSGVRFDSNVELRLEGAGSTPGTGEGKLAGTSSYFIGSDRSLWRPGVPHFARILFHDVYKGIDVAYYGSGGKLEYDFIAAPHADLSRIRLAFKGALSVSETPEGDLSIATLVGQASACGRLQPASVRADVVQRRPRVTQGGKQLASRYQMLPTGKIALKIDGRDSDRPLVIDPVIESATYLGGGSFESANAMKLDSQGNVYLAGVAPSPGPFTGPFSSANNPGQDAMLIKFVPQSNTIASYVFLGGDQPDIAYALTVDSSGAAYLAGATYSSNFPVVNGFQMTPGGGGFADAFVAKIAPDGKSIVYSSYLGGSGTDQAFAVAVDASGEAYIGGMTGSRNFPLPPNGLQSAFGGSILNQASIGFIVAINPAGNKITYGTLLGGSVSEVIQAIALDGSGNVYAGGGTSSSDFPVHGGVQTVMPGDSAGFVAKLSQDLSQLLYSTFIGGHLTTVVDAIAVDSQGSVIAGGSTKSNDFPLRLAPQSTFGGGDADGFVVRLIPQGSDYSFATYLGGSGADSIKDLTLEPNGLLTVAGQTLSPDFPQRNSFQAFQGQTGMQQAFVAKFLLSTNSLVFSTLIGGAGGASASGVQVDSTGATYVAGTAGSGFPVTGNAYQSQFGGGVGDMFLVRISADPNFLAGGVPSLSVSPTVVNFVAALGAGAPPTPATIAVTTSNSSTSFTVDWSGTNWLSASPSRGDAPATVDVFANQAGLAIGVYTGVVRIIPSNGTTPVPISVTLTVANPAPVILAVNPPQVPAGSPDTDFTLTGIGFTASSAVQVSLNDGSLAQTITQTAVTDSTLRFTVPKSLLFRDTLLQVRVKDPGSPSASNTTAIQVGDRFPTIATVANAASGGGDSIAPGEYVTIGGSTLGPPLPLRVLVGDGAIASTALGGVRVLFDGVAAPLLSVVDRKVVVVAPWALAGKQTTQVIVEYLGVRSNSVAVPVSPAAPAMFTADGSGTGPGLIFNDSGLSNSPFVPAAKGSAISIYFTGGGVISPPGIDGKIAGVAGSGPVLPVSIAIDGVGCDLLSIGNALGEVSGMVQASVRVPAGVRSGVSVPIQVSVGGVTSQPGVVLAIN